MLKDLGVENTDQVVDEVSEECLDWYSQNRKECFENVTFVVCGDVVIHWNSEGRFGLYD